MCHARGDSFHLISSVFKVKLMAAIYVFSFPVEKFSTRTICRFGTKYPSRLLDVYMKRFEYYLAAREFTKYEQKKALLLNLAGTEVQDIYETLTDVAGSY